MEKKERNEFAVFWKSLKEKMEGVENARFSFSPPALQWNYQVYHVPAKAGMQI